MELVELNALPIGRPQHREGGPDLLEPDQLPDQRPFDGLLALEREAQLDEERLDDLEVGRLAAHHVGQDVEVDVVRAADQLPGPLRRLRMLAHLWVPPSTRTSTVPLRAECHT